MLHLLNCFRFSKKLPILDVKLSHLGQCMITKARTMHTLPSSLDSCHSILSKIPMFSGVSRNDLLITRLTGWTNTNYKIEHDRKAYVLRICGVGSDKYIDRLAEKENADIASSLNISPKNIYFDTENGTSLRPYIGGLILYDKIDSLPNELIIDVARTLKKLHSHTKPFKNKVDNLSVIEQYKELIEKRGCSLNARYEELYSQIMQLKQVIKKLNYLETPCHNDPNLANFIKSKDAMLLLDWEYSGMGDPAWDIAYVSTHGSFCKAQEDLMLTSYLNGKRDESIELRMHAYKPATEFIFALWIRLQILNGHLPVSKEELEETEEISLTNTEDYLSKNQYQEALYILGANLKNQPINFLK